MSTFFSEIPKLFKVMDSYRLSPFWYQKNEALEKIENPFDYSTMKGEVNPGLLKANKLWISNQRLK